MDRRVISLAHRFVKYRRQGFADDLARLWQKVERVVLDSRLAEAEQAGTDDKDVKVAGEALLLDEIAALKARLRVLEQLLADAGSAPPELARAGLSDAPVVPLILEAGGLGADHYMAPGNGFFALEVDDSGRMYRWTGPTHEFIFDLDCDRRQKHTLQLVLLSGVRPEQCANLALLVDGEPASLKVVREGDTWLMTFSLPPRDEPGLTTLMFITTRVFRPIDLGQGDDTRPLGVRFLALRKID